jgi:hypothetical protein
VHEQTYSWQSTGNTNNDQNKTSLRPKGHDIRLVAHPPTEPSFAVRVLGRLQYLICCDQSAVIEVATILCYVDVISSHRALEPDSVTSPFK